MKKLKLLMLALLVAACLAKTRDWKTAKVEATSETDVSSKAWGEKNTMHYTIETDDDLFCRLYLQTGPAQR